MSTIWSESERVTSGRLGLTHEYLVMLLGLTNAPGEFQNMVNDVLRDFPDRFVFVYLDDISRLILKLIPVRYVRH